MPPYWQSRFNSDKVYTDSPYVSILPIFDDQNEVQQQDDHNDNDNMATYIELLVISLILLLPFLYETSHIFRYYFKFMVYYTVVSINAIILIPPMMLRPCDVKNLLWVLIFFP